MENEVDLSSTNPLDLTPKGSLAIENLDTIKPISPQQPIQLAQNAGPGTIGGGILGTNRLNIKPNPEANDLDTAEAIATQRRNNLQKAASSPWGQFLFPDETRQWAKEAEDESIKIQGIKDKRQQQKDIAEQGAIGGIAPGTMPASATQETLINNLTKRYRETGDVNTQKALIAAKRQDLVETYMPDAVAAQEAKAETHKAVIQDLNKATDQASYNSILQGLPKELRNDPDIPKNYNGPGGWVSKRGQAFNDNLKALQMVNTFKQQQANQQDFTDIQDEKLAGQMGKNAPKLANGETSGGFTPVNHLGNGAIGWRGPQGSNDLSKRGAKDGWDVFDKDSIEAAQKMTEAAFPKAEREKLVSLLRTYELATTSNKIDPTTGKHLRLTDAETEKLINTNPNVQQAVDEGLASAFRGANGGANKGLVNLELAHRGVAQELIDKMIASWSGGRGVFTGKEGEYLSKLTQGQKRFVLDFLNDYTAKDIAGRLGGVANYVGMKGGSLDKIGLEPELQTALQPVRDFANDKEKLRLSHMTRIVRADDSVFLQPGKASLAVPGATVTPLPLSALPGLTPGVSGARSENGALTTSPAAPATSPPPPGGGGGPNPAAGISKEYLIKTAKVESNGNWTEGNNKTSASGAFQFVKGTWDQFKPPGAPDRAADATPQQQTEAANALTNANAKVLAARGVPVNDTTAYMAHNLGAGGAVSLIKADNNADARKVVGEEAAKNNPLFFKGNPTVLEVKERYAKAMSGTALTAKQAEENYYRAASEVPKKLANIAPAIGATGGMLVGGPAGALAGGVAGGAVRQAALGGPGYVDQMARGGLEAIPAMIPGVGPARIAARVAAGGAVPAAEKLYDTGGEDVAGAVESGVAGAVGGAIGEGFGKALGMSGHKIYSYLAPSAQAETMAAAKVLATQEPKIADATGKMVPNKAYEKAEQFVKDRGLDVEHAAYAYNVSKQGVASAVANPKDAIPGTALTKGEALAQRPGAVEAARLGREEYQPIKEQMAGSGGNFGIAQVVKAKPSIPDGPVSTIKTAQNPNGTVPNTKAFRDLAEHYEIEATRKVGSVDERWQRLGNARSELLDKERDALGSTAADSGTVAKAMRDMADSLRVQQEAMARKLLPTDKADAFIARLKNADSDYRRAMTASGDGDIVKAIAKGGAEGREAQAAFNALATNDLAAQRAVRSLVEMQKSKTERYAVGAAVIGGAQLLHLVPGVGSIAATGISAVKISQMLRDYMVKRGAGAPVKFETMLRREIADKGYARRAGSVIGSSIGGQAAQ